MIAENTPTNSDVTPMIAKFFMASMMEIGLALLITCLMLNLYHSTRHSLVLPRFIRVLAIDVLAPILFIATPKKKQSSRKLKAPRKTKREDFLLTQTFNSHNHHRHNSNNSSNSRPMNGHVRPDVIDSPEDVTYRHQSPDDDSDSDIERHASARQCSPRGGPGGSDTQERLLSNIHYMAVRELEREKQEAILDEWEIVVKVADRSFLVLFLLTIVGTSVMIFIGSP